MKKLVSILLLLAMMLTVLVACNGDKGKNEETTPAAQGGSEGGEGEATTNLILPARDLDGYEFRWLCCDKSYGIAYDEGEEYDDSSTSYKAGLQRDAEVKDKLNITFKDVKAGDGGTGNLTNYIVTDAMNPYSSFDVGNVGGPENLSQLVTQKLVADAASIPHLNLDQAWYQQQANEEYSVMGMQYFLAGAFPDFPGTPTFLFNKDMLLELNLELPYDTIIAGEWTIEKLVEYTAAGYKDLGTAGRDENDYFGYVGHDRSICYFYQGMGGQTTTRDENGAVVPVISNDTVDAIFTKVTEFYNQSQNWTNGSLDAGVHSSSHKMFYDGNGLFCYWITGTLDYSKIDTFERGVCILPKYDLDQENYKCPSVGGIKLFAANLENDDYTGYIYEMLCEATLRIVYPATIQEAIDFEKLTDEGSIAVQKIVDQSILFDILKNCDPSGILSSCGYVWYCISNKTTPSAAASSVQAVVERQFSEFFYGKAE